MSYTSIPNQPILFNSVLPTPCDGCNNEYTQIADFNDELFFQLNAGACGSFEYSSNFISSWTKAGSTVSSTGTNGAYSEDYERFDIVGNALLTLSVYSITGNLYVELVGGGAITITAPGTHEIYLSTSNLTSPTITLYFYTDTTNTFTGSFAIDSLTPIPNGGLFVGLVNPDTLAVEHVLNPTLTTSEQYLTAAIALSDYEINAGCYRLAIADYCANTCGQYFIYNPFFNGQPLCIGCVPTGWSNNIISGGTDWQIGGGQAEINFVNATDQTELISVTEFCEDVEYNVTIKVASISNARVRFVVDGVVLQTISTSGTFNFDVTPTQSGAVSIIASKRTRLQGTRGI
jgi:hypothetical protein